MPRSATFASQTTSSLSVLGRPGMFFTSRALTSQHSNPSASSSPSSCLTDKQKAATFRAPPSHGGVRCRVRGGVGCGHDAARHADELLTVAGEVSGALWAQAVWTVANIRVRQGDRDTGAELMNQAIDGFDGRDDLIIWMRLRLGAARLDLLPVPPGTESARQRVQEVQAALPFAGAPTIEQQLLAVRARIAVLTGDLDEARTVLDQKDTALAGLRKRGRPEPVPPSSPHGWRRFGAGCGPGLG